MHNQQKLKKLAKIATESNKIPKDIEEFVLTVLSKQELKDFLRFFKIYLNKKRVYATSSSELSRDSMKTLSSFYKDKEIISVIDKNLGAGLKLQEDDLVVDFTFKKYINDTIERLKN